jgi:hypothetical protein
MVNRQRAVTAEPRVVGENEEGKRSFSTELAPFIDEEDADVDVGPFPR